MAGHFPKLDKHALAKLRELVKEMHSSNGEGVQLPKLLELARTFGSDTGLTVDLDAAHEIGQPMVVVRLGDEARYPDWAELLSPREREVMELVAIGSPNKRIATRLSISLATVKDHVHNILVKSGLSNRSALIAAWPKSPSSGTSKS